jgi:peptidyl-tRNA hydrolase, PTH1 family
MVAGELARRWQLGKAKDRFRGRLAEGRVPAWARPASATTGSSGEGSGSGSPVVGSGRGPQVAILCPQTYMNEAGRSVGPARGAFKLALDRVLVVHDEIDLPFGEIRTRLGGGLAGHNGLKSLKRELGGTDFMRVRVGVGRPDTTDPEVVSAYVLGRFAESPAEVEDLVASACAAVEGLVLGEGD